MNSVKTKVDTKTKAYSIIRRKAIAAVVLIPEKGHFRAYVAWEWEEQAMKGIYGIIESNGLIDKENIAEAINNITDYGNDVTHKLDVRKLFGNLF